MPRLSSRSGQTAVFVFILLLVGLTIALSVSSRTIKDLQSSSTSDLSSRAFAAAEAGVEDALRQALVNGQTGSGSFGNGSRYSFTVSAATDFTQTITRDYVGQVNLAGPPAFVGSVNIYWAQPASIELTMVTNALGNYATLKYAVNSVAQGNNFTNPGDPPDGNLLYSCLGSLPVGYTNCATLLIPPAPVVLRIRPVYNDTSVRVVGVAPATIPNQGYTVTSSGCAGSGSGLCPSGATGGAVRVVKVVRNTPALPPIFDYVLFNGSTTALSK